MSGCHDTRYKCVHGHVAECEPCCINLRIIKRLDEYESRIMKKYIQIENAHNNLAIELCPRIEKLESALSPGAFCLLLERIEKLENHNNFHRRWNENIERNKTPMKCHSCDGKGIIE